MKFENKHRRREKELCCHEAELFPSFNRVLSCLSCKSQDKRYGEKLSVFTAQGRYLCRNAWCSTCSSDLERGTDNEAVRPAEDRKITPDFRASQRNLTVLSNPQPESETRGERTRAVQHLAAATGKAGHQEVPADPPPPPSTWGQPQLHSEGQRGAGRRHWAGGKGDEEFRNWALLCSFMQKPCIVLRRRMGSADHCFPYLKSSRHHRCSGQ